MKIEELASFNIAMHPENLVPVHAFDLSGYGNLYFECGCGERHLVNGHQVIGIVGATPVKVLFRCVNEVYSFVQIKGLFRQKAITLWYCNEDLLERGGDNGGPYRYQSGDKWLDFEPVTF